MTESITETFRQGYRNWRENLILGIPILLNIIVCGLVVFAGVLTAAVAGGIMMLSGGIGMILALIAVAAVFMVAVLLIDSYFNAALIGMSMKAVTGKTSLGDMLDYGGKKTLDFFVATVAVIIIALIALALFIPSVILFYLGLTGPGIAFLVFAGIAYLIIAVVLMASYNQALPAMVVKDLSGINGLREGYGFIKRNKAKVLVFYATYMLITQLSWLVFGVVTGPLKYLSFISEVIYGLLFLFMLVVYMIVLALTLWPMFYLWLTRMYMSEVTVVRKTEEKKAVRQETRGQPAEQQQLYI